MIALHQQQSSTVKTPGQSPAKQKQSQPNYNNHQSIFAVKTQSPTTTSFTTSASTRHSTLLNHPANKSPTNPTSVTTVNHYINLSPIVQHLYTHCPSLRRGTLLRPPTTVSFIVPFFSIVGLTTLGTRSAATDISYQVILFSISLVHLNLVWFLLIQFE